MKVDAGISIIYEVKGPPKVVGCITLPRRYDESGREVPYDVKKVLKDNGIKTEDVIISISGREL